jgi:hypothetical protein
LLVAAKYARELNALPKDAVPTGHREKKLTTRSLEDGGGLRHRVHLEKRRRRGEADGARRRPVDPPSAAARRRRGELEPRRPWRRAPRRVLGVTGGIAAYKAVQLARDLTLLGAEVDVVMTRARARRSSVPSASRH